MTPARIPRKTGKTIPLFPRSIGIEKLRSKIAGNHPKKEDLRHYIDRQGHSTAGGKQDLEKLKLELARMEKMPVRLPSEIKRAKEKINEKERVLLLNEAEFCIAKILLAELEGDREKAKQFRLNLRKLLLTLEA